MRPRWVERLLDRVWARRLEAVPRRDGLPDWWIDEDWTYYS